MQIDDDDELIGASKANKLDSTPSYWHTDQRKYVPAQGYGLGTEVLFMWLTGEDHIHDVCLNPPYISLYEPSISSPSPPPLSQKIPLQTALG